MASFSPRHLLCWLVWLLRAAPALRRHEVGSMVPWRPLNRHQRQEWTRCLSQAWTNTDVVEGAVETAPWLGLWRPSEARLRHRRHRQLFLRRAPKPLLRGTWRGWPNRGRRIGEASNPGPVAPGTPLGGERPPRRRQRDDPDRMEVEGAAGPNASDRRVYCPVPTCPCSDPRRARGWASDASMKAHIDAHLAGSLQGD
ncbi:unnamed protein product, partial [Symbiodinium sp. CCMP2456]